MTLALSNRLVNLPQARVTNELDFLPLPNAEFNRTQGVTSRSAYFANRIDVPFRIQTAVVRFATNTQRNLRIRLWCCPSSTTRPIETVSAGSTMPGEGVNLITGGGSAFDYIAGDGADAAREYNIGQDFGAFWVPAVDAENVDGINVHTVDVTFYMVQRVIMQEHGLAVGQ